MARPRTAGRGGTSRRREDGTCLWKGRSPAAPAVPSGATTRSRAAITELPVTLISEHPWAWPPSRFASTTRESAPTRPSSRPRRRELHRDDMTGLEEAHALSSWWSATSHRPRPPNASASPGPRPQATGHDLQRTVPAQAVTRAPQGSRDGCAASGARSEPRASSPAEQRKKADERAATNRLRARQQTPHPSVPAGSSDSTGEQTSPEEQGMELSRRDHPAGVSPGEKHPLPREESKRCVFAPRTHTTEAPTGK